MARKTNIKNKAPIGVIIIEALNEQKKTQKWLAEEIGISTDWIWRVVSGRNMPSFSIIKKISVALNLQQSDLVNALFKYD